MKEEKLKEIIRKKINFVGEWDMDKTPEYDGFDMSGYNGSFYKNMELLCRFKNYMCPIGDNDWRHPTDIIVKFWKGNGVIMRIGLGYSHNKDLEILVEDTGGWSTEDILFKIITEQNKNLLNTDD